MFTKSCEYGIRASLLLAAQPGDREYTPIKKISEILDISYHFLTKTLQKLTDAYYEVPVH
jgi:DNA-binding IscR family transcriptional regulator